MAGEVSSFLSFESIDGAAYSLTCVSAEGKPYLFISPSHIKTIERMRAESVNYRVVLKNGNTLLVPATNCFIEEAKENFLLNQYFIENDKK